MTSEMSSENNKIIVVGGGPVGALTAILMSQRGFQVDLYEASTDIRKQKVPAGRSINLCLSYRGIEALKRAGIDDIVSTDAVPLRSRYIHLMDGRKSVQNYGGGNYLYSIGRGDLNKKLLSFAEKRDNINIHFEQKTVRVDVEIPSMTFKGKDGLITTVDDAKIIIGCDGAYSVVRMNMLRNRLDFSQSYIDLGYKELTIPPTAAGEYAIPPNHIHIWPRKKFSVVGLPNLDKSFTCTLLMRVDEQENITSGEDVVNIFETHFKEIAPLIKMDTVKESFFKFPPWPMVTVRCKPYHFKDRAVLLGDAAHAVVPFGGQGLNCGLEDTLILDELMDKFDDDFSVVLPKFSELRLDACNELANLALHNYKQVHSGVANPWYIFQQKVVAGLRFFLPNTYIPRFNLMTFTRIPYHEVVKQADKQDRAMNASIIAIGCSIFGIGAYSLSKFFTEACLGCLGSMQQFRERIMDLNA